VRKIPDPPAQATEHVIAAGQLDQLRRPVSGNEHRIEPLQGRDAWAWPIAHGELHAVHARGDLRDERDAGVAAIARLGERAHVAERLVVTPDPVRL